MSETVQDLYQFTFRAVDRADDGYYVTRWDLATEFDVVAANKQEAWQKLLDVLGPAPDHRHWVASLQRAKDIRIVQADGRS